MKKRNTAKPKTRVLSVDEIRVFWTMLDRIGGMTPAICDALRLQLLTAVRIGEVLEAERSEIDLEARLWTIPALRTKAERQHVLPLSLAAATIFAAALERADLEGRRRAARTGNPFEPSRWVFPSERSSRALLRRGDQPARLRRAPGAIEPHAATRAVVRKREEFTAAGIATFRRR